MWLQVAGRGVPADKFALHFDGLSVNLPPAEDEPALLVDRGEITMALREHLEGLEAVADTTAGIEYSSPLISVDLVRRHVTVRRDAEDGKEEILPYDLLVGCDGVRSLIRRAMLAQLPAGSFESELRLLPGRWKTLHTEMPEGFGADTVHANVSPSAPFGLFTIPSPAPGPACTIVSWSAEAPPEDLLAAQTPEEVNAVLRRCFPKFGRVPDEAAHRFLAQRPSKAIAARCMPMHNSAAAVALVGDAAHPVGTGSLGQGCNAALQDAAALADCLKEAKTLEEALAAYSQRQAPEGWALLDLLELQAASEARAAAVFQGPVLLGFFLEQLGRGILGPFLRQLQVVLYQRRSSSMRRSARQLRAFFDHLELRGAREFGLPVLGFISEQFALGALARLFGIAARAVDLPLQKALMATTEPYSRIARRNKAWLTLVRQSSGKGSAGAVAAEDFAAAPTALPPGVAAAVAAMAKLGPPGEAIAAMAATPGRLLEGMERSIRDTASDAADFAQEALARLNDLVSPASPGPSDANGPSAPTPVSLLAEPQLTTGTPPAGMRGSFQWRPRQDNVLAEDEAAAVFASSSTAPAPAPQLDEAGSPPPLPAALAALRGDDREAWLAALRPESRLRGETVVRESAPCGRFFVIRSGTCGVFQGGRRLAALGPGDSFGEVALLTGAPSPVAVLAESDVALSVVAGEAFLRLASRNDVRASLEAVAARYGVTRTGLEAAQAEARRQVRPLIMQWLGHEGVDAAAELVDKLLNAASCEAYAAGDVVELEPGRLRLVQAGTCSVVAGGKEIRRLVPGDTFLGPERAPRGERVVATSQEVRLCSLDLGDLEEMGAVSASLEVQQLVGELAG